MEEKQIDTGDLIVITASNILARVINILKTRDGFIKKIVVRLVETGSVRQIKKEDCKIQHHFQQGDIIEFSHYFTRGKSRFIKSMKVGVLLTKQERWEVLTLINGEERTVECLPRDVVPVEW